MKQQFHLSDSFIDLSRNQIRRNDQTQTLPPKAMAVLAYLAERQSQVISQDELLEQVWHGTVVSPNTLQRSIAQLRKALGDDSKAQGIIQTHAKRGYSLEVAIVYPQSTDLVNSLPAKGNHILAVLTGLIAVLILGFANWPTNPPEVTFNQMRLLTTTDAKEAGASYSPDGRFAIFHRFAGLCANNLWAKDLSSGEEIQLTDKFGIYGGHSFSPDGKQLVFRARETCFEQNTTKNNHCWHLMTLNFEAALQSPRQPQLMLSCEGSRVGDPKWLSNGDILLLQYMDNHWQLVTYPPGERDYKVLFADKASQPYAMDYSAAFDTIALLSIDDQGEHQIVLLDSQGQLKSNATIEKPELLGDLGRLHLNFEPQSLNLLFAVGKRIYTLSGDGVIKPLSYQVNHQIFQPKLHASGKKLIATYGIFDHDIAQISLDGSDSKTSAAGFNQTKTPYPSIARSILDDNDARFSPIDTTLSFVSESSGKYQLWLSQTGATKQLTRFDSPAPINGYDWHPSEQRLIAAKGSLLYDVSNNGDIQRLSFKYPVLRVHHWYHNDKLLLSAMIKGQPTLISWHMLNNQIETHVQTDVFDASVLDNGSLVYFDKTKRFWHKNQQRLKPLKSLDSMLAARHFAHSDNRIFAISRDNQLFSYDIDNESLTFHRDVDPYVNYLSDIKGQQVLLTQTISVKKEVVEFTP